MSGRVLRIAVAVLVLAAVCAGGALWWWRSGWDISAASTNLDVPGLDEAALSERGISRVSMGMLEVPTGRLITTDPLVQPDRSPLTRTVPPGRYEVVLFKAEGRVAMASLIFADKPVASWELGLLEGQNQAALARDEFYGFPVDAGLGSFMDMEAAKLMAMRDEKEQLNAAGGAYDYYSSVLAPEMGELDFLFHKPIPTNRVNSAIFWSGWGDGYYPAIWGLDADNQPVKLVIDFYVLNDGRVVEPVAN